MTPAEIIAKQFSILTYGDTADERPNDAAAEVIVSELLAVGFDIVGPWQPIESAPKDGTKILLWDNDYKEVCAGAWREKRNGWMACGTEEYMTWTDFTHWKPAPPGPGG